MIIVSQEGRHSEFRFERKFLTNQLSFFALEQLVKRHPACFREIFQVRKVNNIYFDTPTLNFFSDNIAGKSDRQKVRIRWYGDDIDRITKPVLEFKIKAGLVGRKSSYLLPDFILPDIIPTGFFIELFKRSDLPGHVLEILLQLEPVLLNLYERKYYMSFDGNFRFTLDSKMNFYDFKSRQRGLRHSFPDRYNRVLELKYDKKLDERASWIVNQLPIRVTKSSKYVSGVYRFRYDLTV